MFSAVGYKVVGPPCEFAILTRGYRLETMLDVKHANLQDSITLLVNLQEGELNSLLPRGPPYIFQ
jgi:hypothetical protein